MAMYSYNGVTLPEMPIKSGYQLIYRSGSYYILEYSVSPYTLHGSNICNRSGATAAVYATIAGAHEWVKASFSGGGEDYNIATTTEQYIWTSHDIRSVTVEKDEEGNIEETDTGLAYSGSEPVWVAPDTPSGYFGWEDGDGSYRQSEVTMPQITADTVGWNCQLNLHCQASVSDGGTLQISWYKDGAIVKQAGPSVGSLYSSYKPPVDKLGTSSYYAVITNSLNGKTVSEKTPTVKVTIIEFDLGNLDKETGEDSTGTITPGFVYPDSGGDSGGDDGGDTGGDSGGDSGGDDTGEDPVIMHGTGWLALGWLMGRVIAGQRKKRDPVAYLYNGIRLPPIPEEITAYPYVVIQNGNTQYVFGFSQKPTTYITDWNFEKKAVTGVPKGVAFGMAFKLMSRDEWTVHSNPGPHESLLENTCWANYDVLNLDGSVYLEASEPIPVYD